VSAKNSLGFGIASTLNILGATAKYEPHKPTTTPTRGEGTSPTALVVDYPTPEDETTGGSEITSLHLQWDKGTDGIEWTTLIGETPYTTST